MSDRVLIEINVVKDIVASAAIAAATTASPGIGASDLPARSDLLSAGMQHPFRVRLHNMK